MPRRRLPGRGKVDSVVPIMIMINLRWLIIGCCNLPSILSHRSCLCQYWAPPPHGLSLPLATSSSPPPHTFPHQLRPVNPVARSSIMQDRPDDHAKRHIWKLSRSRLPRVLPVRTLPLNPNHPSTASRSTTKASSLNCITSHLRPHQITRQVEYQMSCDGSVGRMMCELMHREWELRSSDQVVLRALSKFRDCCPMRSSSR